MPQSPAFFFRPAAFVRAALVVVLVSALFCRARDFSVAAYNAENLFDVDGRSAYAEYQPERYTPAHLATKLTNFCEVLARLDPERKGPDIVILNEIEVDQTPSSTPDALRALVAAQAGTDYRRLLAAPLSDALKDWPVEAWLLKALEDRGLQGYTVVVGSDSDLGKHEDGNVRAIKCAVLTRFPVKELRNHPIPNARNIVEVLLDIDGSPLRVFANHWKSGAGDAKLEQIRVADARVLRRRLDEVLAEDPAADILLGGDFNSQYNQRQRNPRMQQTGVEDILGSQGRELALREGSAGVYNLWFELPPSKRGSDVYQGEWGTLIQLLITRGLHDFKGIQYVDNSFRVGRYPGLNEADDGTPLRWSGAQPAGSGYSDHFPVIADFTTTREQDTARWISLDKPANAELPSETPKVNFGLVDLAAKAKPLDQLPKGTELRGPTQLGKLFLVSGTPISGQRLAVDTAFGRFEIYTPDRELLKRLRSLWKEGDKVRFYGEFGQYKGTWQFVIKDPSWVLKAEG